MTDQIRAGEAYFSALCWYELAAMTKDPVDRRAAYARSAEYAYEQSMRADLSPRMRIASGIGHRRMVLAAGLTKSTGACDPRAGA